MVERVIFSLILLISQTHLTTNYKLALQNASSCCHLGIILWYEGKKKRWEGCVRFHLQKMFHYKMYFPLPEEGITRILLCKNLPEAEFLCYRNVITNVDIEHDQKRFWWKRGRCCFQNSTVAYFDKWNPTLLYCPFEKVGYASSFCSPEYLTPKSQQLCPALTLCKHCYAQLSENFEGREGRGNDMKLTTRKDRSREGRG